jgi:hypothetical protein
MVVELDLFSGRSNPRWELDARSRDHLAQLQRRLSPTRAAADPPGLGYRGFVWHDGAGGAVSRVYGGYLRTPTATLADPAFSIERYLLERLPAEFGSVRPRVAAEIGRLQRDRGR